MLFCAKTDQGLREVGRFLSAQDRSGTPITKPSLMPSIVANSNSALASKLGDAGL